MSEANDPDAAPSVSAAMETVPAVRSSVIAVIATATGVASASAEAFASAALTCSSVPVAATPTICANRFAIGYV